MRECARRRERGRETEDGAGEEFDGEFAAEVWINIHLVDVKLDTHIALPHVTASSTIQRERRTEGKNC